MDPEKRYSFLDLSHYLPSFAIGVFLLLLSMVFMIYRSYLVSVFTAILLYILARKPHYWLIEKVFHKKINLAATISTFLVLIIAILPIIFLFSSLISEAQVAIETLRTWATHDKIENLLSSHSLLRDWFNLTSDDFKSFENKLLNITGEIGLQTIKQTLKQGGTLIAGMAKFSFNFILSIIILFFLFRGGHKLGPIIYRALPFPDDIERAIGNRMVGVLDAVIKGNVLISILQGLVLGILFASFSLPTPILYGTLAAFFSLIPVIGTMIFWLPAAIFLFVSGSSVSAIVFAITCLSSYLILENLVKPLLLDKKLNLHPLFLFLAILGGINEFGMKGVILGPFIVTVFMSVWQLLAVWNEKYGNITR